MIIKSATRFALAAGCLTAIVTLPTADAQMGAPGGYGYAPRQAVMATAPRQAPMAMALHQALMGMARRKEPIPHQEPMARRQAPMVRGQAPMARRKGPMPRRPSMSRRPPQARPEPS